MRWFYTMHGQENRYTSHDSLSVKLDAMYVEQKLSDTGLDQLQFCQIIQPSAPVFYLYITLGLPIAGRRLEVCLFRLSQSYYQ